MNSVQVTAWACSVCHTAYAVKVDADKCCLCKESGCTRLPSAGSTVCKLHALRETIKRYREAAESTQRGLDRLLAAEQKLLMDEKMSAAKRNKKTEAHG